VPRGFSLLGKKTTQRITEETAIYFRFSVISDFPQAGCILGDSAIKKPPTDKPTTHFDCKPDRRKKQVFWERITPIGCPEIGRTAQYFGKVVKDWQKGTCDFCKTNYRFIRCPSPVSERRGM
jgi:hypothetical protein